MAPLSSLSSQERKVKTNLLPSVEYQVRAAPFGYRAGLPLDLQESGVEYQDGIAIHDVSYAGVASERVGAFLVTPSGHGKFPGVVFVHPTPGNRHTFLDEAVQLAHQGAVSLLIDAPWSRGEAWGRAMGEPEHDLQEHLTTAKDLRRAIDLLSERPEVAANRIAYVGHSFGALFGGILAGVEQRLSTCVLIAGAGSFTDVAVLNLPQLRGPTLDHYREVLAPIDPRLLRAVCGAGAPFVPVWSAGPLLSSGADGGICGRRQRAKSGQVVLHRSLFAGPKRAPRPPGVAASPSGLALEGVNNGAGFARQPFHVTSIT